MSTQRRNEDSLRKLYYYNILFFLTIILQNRYKSRPTSE